MKRIEKEHIVDSLAQNFAESQAAFVVGYKGLSVAQLHELRARLRAQKGTLKVAKARLMKRSLAAAEGEHTKELVPYCKEQIALVFAKDEAAPVAKVLFEFAQQVNALSIVAGLAEQQVLTAQGVTELATLPSRTELLARLCGALNASVSKFVCTLKAVADQKERAQ